MAVKKGGFSLPLLGPPMQRGERRTTKEEEGKREEALERERGETKGEGEKGRKEKGGG